MNLNQCVNYHDFEKLAKQREYKREYMRRKRAQQKAVKIVESDN